MKSLVCQAQHLELNPLLYGQPMKLTKDWGDMFILPSIGYYPSGSDKSIMGWENIHVFIQCTCMHTCQCNTINTYI